jgi:hypothetical protein
MQATAARTSLVRIGLPQYDIAPAVRARKADRYIRFYLHQVAQRANTPTIRPELLKPTQFRPKWYSDVERRLRDSIASQDVSASHDGRWLSWMTAEAARRFFDAAADVLPGEPYMYSSAHGDLVAEFELSDARVTAIVSPSFLILFGSRDGETKKLQLGPEELNAADMRGAVENLNEWMGQQRNGALGT